MPSMVVIGAQWGDEGKGKLVDYLTSNADWVVRFQGGNNAGHTVVVDGVTTKLSLVPSGILRPQTRCALAAGVVIDPETLLKEIEQLRKTGVTVDPARLVLDRDAHLILEYHKLVDAAREESLGEGKIGTTGRGIGPAYEDRAARTGIRMAELLVLPELERKLEQYVEAKNAYLALFKGSARVEFERVRATLRRAAELLGPHIGNVSMLVHEALHRGQRVVFEGAQGTLLDQVHGTVPFVTSSNTIAGGATTGVGVGPKALDYVLGVVKAYTTRVGSGPFPTELHGEQGDRIRERGHEFGTVTGRPRRCGWFDAVAIKRAVRLNGIDSMAVTKLDVLSGCDKIRICIRYHMDGRELDDVPSLASELDRVVPDYIELDGWKEDLSGVRKWHQLPPAARLYLSTISEIIGCPITVVSVGPDRNSTLFSSHAGYVRNFVSASGSLMEMGVQDSEE